MAKPEQLIEIALVFPSLFALQHDDHCDLPSI
jgi:hypothetical protein